MNKGTTVILALKQHKYLLLCILFEDGSEYFC